MPIPYAPGAPSAAPAAHPAGKGLESGSGVIVYDWDPQQGSLRGTFVLALYGGALATEKGQKVGADIEVLAGAYDIETYTPTGKVFAVGQLVLTAVGDNGAYNAVYILRPTQEQLAALGYAVGTTMIFKAIGYKIPDRDQLAVSWDNNVYTRSWSGSQREWGYRYVAGT